MESSAKKRRYVMSKQELMEEVVSAIRICRRCQLWRTAKNPVPGEGSLDTSLMFIGEAPGYREDSVGRPFMGAAGQLLDKLLASIGLKRDEVYIGNMVKPRPPDNRDPRRDEVEACTPYLDRQIMILKPSLIVTMGRHSTSYIFSKVNVKVQRITDVRGRVFRQHLLNLPVSIIPPFILQHYTTQNIDRASKRIFNGLREKRILLTARKHRMSRTNYQ